AERRELWFDAPLSEPEFLNRMTLSLVVGMVLAAIGGGLWWRWRRSRVTPGVQFLVALGIMVGIWTVLGIRRWAIDIAFDALLPLIAFVVLAFGEFMLIMQAGVVGQLNEDYVGTARAKGLRERTIRDRHASKN